MSYFDEIKSAMDWLATKPETLFLGQSVGVSGTFMYNTLKDVPPEKRRELPVCESLQMQMTLGLSLAGITPISIFPRLNFLSLALGDMINMVDKIPDISRGQAPVSMIIRSAVGPDQPVHPGYQHIGDFTDAFKKIFHNIEVVRLDKAEHVLPAYKRAFEEKTKSHLLIEVGNLYNEA